MDFPSRSRFKNEDSRLPAAQEETFECHKPTKREKEPLCQEDLFEDVKSPIVLLNANSADDTVQSAVDLQNQIKIKEESDVNGFYASTFNEGDLLFDSDEQKESFGQYKFLEENQNSFYEDNVLEDVDMLLNANSAEAIAQIEGDFQIQVKTEEESDSDRFSAPPLNAADLLGESDDGQEKSDDEEERLPEPGARRLFVCPSKNCPSSFKMIKEFEEHMEIHSDDQEFFCDVCKKDFSSKEDAMTHILEREKKECCGCGKTFSCASQLLQHLRYHSGEKPFFCKTCSQQFAQRNHLNVHMLRHTGEKPFPCGFCKKSFAMKHCLKKHELIHSGEKPYKCGHCDYSCNTSCSLSRHNRRHNGEKPYSCGRCEKRFSQKFDLKRHEFVHSGEKSFECDHCGRKFNVKSNLKKHILRLHNRQFSCKKCEEKFTQNGSLEDHMKKYHKS